MTATPTMMLSTKFAPPRISSHCVPREHLLERLQEAGHSRLFLVTGGAGFGKTTLLAQWRQALLKEGAAVVWLTLSADDNSLEAFHANLVGSLRQAGVLDDTEVYPASVLDEGAQLIPALLINQLTRIGDELYLIVDDFHLATDARIARLIQALLDSAPHNLHLVLSTRQAPELQLGRCRARGDLCELDCAELTFDFRESHAFLRANLDPAINVDAAHALHEQTNGWPIGLQLLSISLKANPRRRLPSTSGSAELGAYLVEDVLADLPVELLEFLQKLSILRRINVEVAEFVTGAADAEDMLRGIEARNLFLLPVDVPGEHHWFRLHPMFVEFLTLRLDRTAVDQRVLHRRAAEWFEAAGLVSEAMSHALLTCDFDYVVELLGRVPPPLNNITQLNQFMHWLERVPQDSLLNHPDLFLLGIWACVLTLRIEKAQAWVTALGRTEHGQRWSVQLDLIRAALALQRDDPEESLSLLTPLASTALENAFLEQVRYSVYVNGLASAGRYTEARRFGHSTLARAVRQSQDEMAFIAMTSSIMVSLYEGNMLEAERTGARLLLEAEMVHGRRSVSACSLAAQVAPVFYELGRLDDAREALANRLDVLRLSAPQYMINLARCHGRLQWLQEGPRQALAYFKQKEEDFRTLGYERGVAHMLAEQIRIALAGGDWRFAETLQVNLDDLRRDQCQPGPHQAEVAVLGVWSTARVAMARRQPEMALRVLDEADHLAADYSRGLWRVQTEVLRALALAQSLREEESRECLRAALAMGYRLGLQRTFIDEGEPLRGLLARLGTSGDTELDGYLAGLSGESAEAQVQLATESAAVSRVDSLLTKREREILGLLEQSMSNKRIALTLNLSLQTVKWNLRNIFSKLEVSSRYDAILAARKQDRG
ncbi:LuxR C-terminal-related transcriptional regulator [Pseudomonas sp. BGr12]|uniref:LuxR C-terminal-related transcriptional regulator n=1 Tax=Pseudomonas sp. BGr12 TaxID=2936269 RepID=UPI002559EF64|nr:LuxR C-terminal-related transcriptional regulator [Pseudomonas sp. BJa5]MDL2430856.1 LuxR C-terminal-related transcriptional regulator [Pseudomonas sp. BJa5]